MTKNTKEDRARKASAYRAELCKIMDASRGRLNPYQAASVLVRAKQLKGKK